MQNKFNSKSGWNILKILGAILIALCPLIVGFKKSNNLKQNQIKIEKIIELINWIISEIKFKKTEISSMFFNISKNKNFKNLEFLQNLKKNLKIYPFPKAWETSIENWEEFPLEEEKEYLKSLSNILGAIDSNGQILNLKHTKFQFEERLKHATNTYISKGKICKSLGALLGVAVFIIFI